MVYTKGVLDVNYSRPVFGYLICIATYFTCVRLPYEQVIYAAGEFKRTKKGAYYESAINIITSIALVNVWKLNGIVIGTIVALSYRTFRYYEFVRKNIVEMPVYNIIDKILYTVISVVLNYVLCSRFPLKLIGGYGSWIRWAFIISVVVSFNCVLLGVIMFRKDVKELFKLGMAQLKGKHKMKR